MKYWSSRGRRSRSRTELPFIYFYRNLFISFEVRLDLLIWNNLAFLLCNSLLWSFISSSLCRLVTTTHLDERTLPFSLTKPPKNWTEFPKLTWCNWMIYLKPCEVFHGSSFVYIYISFYILANHLQSHGRSVSISLNITVIQLPWLGTFTPKHSEIVHNWKGLQRN